MLPALPILSWKLFSAIIWHITSKPFQIPCSEEMFSGSAVRLWIRITRCPVHCFRVCLAMGSVYLTYFGHSSSSTLGFNLDDPSIYTNQSKYPVMYVNGCYAGNYFTFDPSRLGTGKTLSENYVLIQNKGCHRICCKFALWCSELFESSAYEHVRFYDHMPIMEKVSELLNLDAGRELLTSFADGFLCTLSDRTNGHSWRSCYYIERRKIARLRC